MRRVTKGLATNPLIWACVLGLIAGRYGVKLPVFLQSACTPLAATAFPMALLAIGAQLAAGRIGARVGTATVSSALKTVVAPGLGWIAARLLGLPAWETCAALILLATPTAVASYVLADQLGSDSDLAAAAVVVSTLVSFFTLGAVVLLLGGG